jgi:hypothetical protein
MLRGSCCVSHAEAEEVSGLLIPIEIRIEHYYRLEKPASHFITSDNFLKTRPDCSDPSPCKLMAFPLRAMVGPAQKTVNGLGSRYLGRALRHGCCPNMRPGTACYKRQVPWRRENLTKMLAKDPAFHGGSRRQVWLPTMLHGIGSGMWIDTQLDSTACSLSSRRGDLAFGGPRSTSSQQAS